MATTIPLKFIKDDEIPAVWEPNAVYFIKDNSYAESFVTANDGTPEEMGNSIMIKEVAALLPVSSFPNDAGYITVAEVPPGFSGDYNDLTNKPDIPNSTNDLVNDSGFITPSSPAALTNKTGNISQWTNNIGYITAAQVPPGFSGNYNDLTNKPTIPDSTNDLVNDSGFITAGSTNLLTNKSGNISQWSNDSGYITASSGDTLTNKSGQISQWTNNAGYMTAGSTNTLTNKSGSILQWTNDAGFLTAAAINYRDVAEQPYTGTIVWNGTAPSGTAFHTYQWTQIGKLVTLRINLRYANTGNNNSIVTMTLPGDCPTPFIPTGFNAADNILYTGSGRLLNSLTAAVVGANTTAVHLRINPANNGFLIGIYVSATGTLMAAYVTIQYWAA